MLTKLENNINNEYPNYVNKSICNLGCDKERSPHSKYNCSNYPDKIKPEFKLKNYIDIEKIKHQSFATELVKICDGVKINKDNILLLEITAPFIKKEIKDIPKEEKYDNIKKEFIKKIEGTKKIVSLLIKRYDLNFPLDDIQIKFRPVFKPKPKCTIGQESYDILLTSMLLKALPIKQFTILKYFKCS